MQAVSASLLEKLILYLNEEESRELGKWWAENIGRDVASLWFKKTDLESLNQTLALLDIYANRYRLEIKLEPTKETLVMNHNLGEKWSFFWEEAIKVWFGKLVGKELKHLRTETTENQVIAHLDRAVPPSAMEEEAASGTVRRRQ